ncbi:MAG: retron system putative HNH endonuclease [Bacteroidota bacterium]|nr:retron system putative HNH endonuclease [Bacteroidota bacterium]
MLNFKQNNQCAYTEKLINSKNSHIDHFKKQNVIKQGLFNICIFSWNNLLTSYNNEFYGAKFKDKKIKNNDYGNLINPIIENPNDFLEYSTTRQIIAINENIKGQATIDLLNLNDYELVSQRKTVAMQVESMHNEFSVNEIVKFIGKFESFIKGIYTDFENTN